MRQMSRIGQYMVNQKLKIDWADAHSDAFQPELYQPMRRIAMGSRGPQRPPYERGATPFEVDGLDTTLFDDSQEQSWMSEMPRPPIR
jgi:hypothetical protein